MEGFVTHRTPIQIMYAVTKPAPEETLAEVGLAGQADVDQAVAAARSCL